jgi:hypothetical protein
MSRTSKNAKNLARARRITEMHKQGEKGPARTTPLHGKKWTYRSNPDTMKRLNELLKGPQENSDKTAGKKILRNAGGAAQQ